MWTGKVADLVLSFLEDYKVDEQVRSISLPLLRDYIELQQASGYLVQWTIAVKGRSTQEKTLGKANWGVPGGDINMISRSRLSGDRESIGVLTSPNDETTGFTDEQKARAERLRQAEDIGLNPASRRIRDPAEGLLLLYPISRFSRPDSGPEARAPRQPLYDNPRDPLARDIVGVAISFPKSPNAGRVRGYAVGTTGWKPE